MASDSYLAVTMQLEESSPSPASLPPPSPTALRRAGREREKRSMLLVEVTVQ
jgi:hypothetical protein